MIECPGCDGHGFDPSQHEEYDACPDCHATGYIAISALVPALMLPEVA